MVCLIVNAHHADWLFQDQTRHPPARAALENDWQCHCGAQVAYLRNFRREHLQQEKSAGVKF
jgi:hypothetical protein